MTDKLPHRLNPELAEFLSAYYTWAAEGASSDQFSRKWGLCTNLRIQWLGGAHLAKELAMLLEADFGQAVYPFGAHYWGDVIHRTQHLNQVRLDWVRRKLGGCLEQADD